MMCQHVEHLKPVAMQPYKDMLCSCQFSEDRCWYRAQVKGKTLVVLSICYILPIILHGQFADLRGESVVIQFVDYGNNEVVTKDKLLELPDELLSTPVQVSYM